MARYRGSDMDLAYGDLPPTERWDAGRFNRESQRARQAPVIEQRPPYDSARRREPAYYEDDRYYREQYESGPRGTRDRQFFEEDEYYDPRATQGAMVPFRPARPARPAAPPRPALIRRQSSVDRIDFERRRQYDRDDYRPPPPSRPRGRNSRYEINIYDDVKVQDPEFYGDDGFREYREREWTRSRTRNDSPSPGRRAPTEIIDARPPSEHFEETITKKETVIEKPYPRRGKTRMPKRLVHTKVLFDLGYPFYEEDEKTILIEKALGPENIDEVFARSKEIRERETITTRLIEAPSGPSPTALRTQTISDAPRSVREWDNMAALERSPSPGSSVSQSTRRSHRRARSQASRRSKSIHESIHEDIHRDRGSVHESIHKDFHRDVSRSPSPARTATTHRSRKTRARSRVRSRSRRSRSRSSDITIIEKKVIRRDDVEESGTVDLNFPLAIAKVENRSRTDADIRDEIRRLERERRDIRRDTEVIRYDRRSRVDTSPIGILREPSPRGEIIVADSRDEVVAVRKDKRDRARSRSRPPGPGLLKSMMYTVT